MLIILSPAKSLRENGITPPKNHTSPEFIESAQTIVNKLKKISVEKLCELMSISEKLGEVNYQRYQNWSLPVDTKNACAAVFLFQGDVYQGLDVDSFKAKDHQYLQKHLRILSGLYGVLRPLDLIQPYRLEMGAKLKIGKATDLYQFWDERITDSLNQSLVAQGDQVLVNLASNEYFKSVKKRSLSAEVITPVFKEKKAGKYKVLSFFAKKARGRFASWMLRNRIEQVEDLKQFQADDYRFNKQLSDDKQFVFSRNQP